MIESGLSGQGSWSWTDGGVAPGTWVLCVCVCLSACVCVRVCVCARGGCCRWLADSVVELARGASGGVHSRLVIRVSRKTSISDAVHQLVSVLRCAVMGGGSFFQRLCEAATPRPELGRGSRELAACTCFCRLFRSDEVARAQCALARWARSLASLSPSRLCAGLLSMHRWRYRSFWWRGGRLDITYLGLCTENVRRFAPKRVPVDTNQAAGCAGGLEVALRVSQYTMAGRVGGCERRRRY